MKVINLTDITDELETGKTYTLWQENTGAVYGQINEVLNGVTKYIYSQTQNKVTFVAKEGAIYSFVAQASTVEVTGTLTNYKNRFMVYEGTDDKEFEQYGVMPSLDYPSEIQSVGDVKYNLELGTILAVNGGNADNNARVRIKEYIKVVPGAECIIDAEGIDEVVVFEYDKDKKYLFRVGWEKIPYTFNLSENTRYIRYIFRKKDNSVLTVDSVKDKSKHLRSVEITTSNKNVLDIQKNVHAELNGITADIDDGGIITLNGTATNAVYLKLYDDNQIFAVSTVWNTKKLAKGNWTFSSRLVQGEINTTANTSAYVRSKATGADAVEYAMLYRVLNAKEKQKSFTLEDDTKAVIYLWIGKDVTFNNVKLQFQLELDALSKYTTHRGETLTMPIQSKMFEGDTFEQIGDVWYEKHCKKEKTITGNDIQSVSSNNRVFFKISSVPSFKKISEEFYYGNIDKNTIESNVATSLTGHSLTWLATAKKGDWISSWNNPNDTNGFVLRTDKEFATKEEAIIYFNENPFTVVYELLEIEYIKCTAEQCKILDKIDTYKDGTIITTDNDLCKIQLRYKQDLEKRITALEKQIATQTVAESE